MSAVVAAAGFVALIVVYLWSRGGQTTEVRLEAAGNSFSTFIDGRAAITREFSAAPAGGLVVVIDTTDKMPSLPSPGGIDSITVRDRESGKVLFRDSFDHGPETGVWKVLSGKVRREGGTWEADGAQLRIQLDGPFDDVTVDARFRNAASVEIGLRTTSSNSGVFIGVRPFRLIDTSLSLRSNGQIQDIGTKVPIQLSRVESLRAMAAMALRPLPLLAVIAAAGVVALAVLAFLPSPKVHLPQMSLPRYAVWLPAAGLAIFAFVATARLITGPAEGVPHVPDELSYIFEARTLASGHFYEPVPKLEELFRWSNPAPIIDHEGRWSSMYPPGHPIVLAVGVFIGALWLIPPLIGAACVLLLFATARRMYGTWIAAAASLLFAISPFFLMTASNFMSHNTTALYLLAALYFLSRIRERPLLFGAGCGFFIGMVFSARQLSGLALVPPFGIFLMAGFAHRDTRASTIRELSGVIAGGLAALCLYLLYEWLATGNPFTIETTQGGDNAFGFSGAHSLAVGLSNEQAQLAHLLLVLNNWTPMVGLLLVLMPFAFGTRNRWDWFLLGCSLCLMAAYTLYFVNGLMHGPRYWYETTPLLMILSARGIQVTGDRLCAWSKSLLARANRPGTARPGVAYALIGIPFLVLALNGTRLWLFTRDTPWFAEFVPNSAHALRGFNGVDARLNHEIEGAHLQNALLIADECGAWQCYGTIFLFNNNTLDGNVVAARRHLDRPELTAALLDAYPDRFVYHVNYQQRLLEPYPVPDGRPIASLPPRAQDVPRPALPTPTPIADKEAALARDNQRIADLQYAARLLSDYYQRNGKYPEARNPQTLCVYPSDAGCAIKQGAPVPRDPSPDRGYVYWSDGATFVVVARLELAAPNCSASLPSNLNQEGPLACVSGPPG